MSTIVNTAELCGIVCHINESRPESFHKVDIMVLSFDMPVLQHLLQAYEIGLNAHHALERIADSSDEYPVFDLNTERVSVPVSLPVKLYSSDALRPYDLSLRRQGWMIMATGFNETIFGEQYGLPETDGVSLVIDYEEPCFYLRRALGSSYNGLPLDYYESPALQIDAIKDLLKGRLEIPDDYVDDWISEFHTHPFHYYRDQLSNIRVGPPVHYIERDITKLGPKTGQGLILVVGAMQDRVCAAQTNIMLRVSGPHHQIIDLSPATEEKKVSFLHHALRRHPDIILAGDIRTEECANLVIDMSRMGILIIVSLHARGENAVERLTDISGKSDVEHNVMAIIDTSEFTDGVPAVDPERALTDRHIIKFGDQSEPAV